MKRYSFSSIVLFALAMVWLFGATSLLQAQSPHYEWVRGIGERVYHDAGIAVATDSIGNAYMTGQFVAKITFGKTKLTNTKGNKDNVDAFVTKYNQFGQAVWAKRITGANHEYPKSIAVDASGNSYVTGYYASSTLTSGTSTITSGGGNDMFLAKFDANGNPQWLRGAGGAGIDTAYAVTVDNNGNVYVIGSFESSSITFGGTTLTNNSMIGVLGVRYSDIFVVKYDPSGAVLWAQAYGDSSFEEGRDIRIDDSGNIFLCGSFSSDDFMVDSIKLAYAGGSHPSGAGYPDFFVAKLTSNRQVYWAKSYGYLAAETPWAVDIDDAGNTYLAAAFESDSIRYSPSIKFDNAGYRDFLLMKFAPTGDLQWVKHSGGEYSDDGLSLSVDGAGNSYVAGYYESSSLSFDSVTLNNASTPQSKMFIVKYDTDGNVLWVQSNKQLAGDEHAYGVVVNGSGALYATGSYTNNMMMFDNYTIVNSNQSLTYGDIYLLKIYEATVTPTTMFRTFTQADLDITAANTKKTTANFGNARDTTFLRAFPGISSKKDPAYPGGLVLGIARPDSVKLYGWIRFTLKGKTIQDFVPQTGTARGFDILGGKPFVKEVKNPMLKKYNNSLAGGLAALKMNIAASMNHVTQEGFRDLVFNHPTYPTHVFNGKSIDQISKFVDTMLTYYKLHYTSSPTVLYDSAARWLDTINGAFSGALAFESTNPIRLTGVKQLADIEYLEAPVATSSFIARGKALQSNMVEQFSLAQNYPNPFNPSTMISFRIGNPSMVTLKIYDILGKEVATVLNSEGMDQGEYDITFNGTSLASGIYFYKLTAASVDGKSTFNEVKRMLLLK